MVDEWRARADRPVTVPLLHVRLAEQLLTKEPALRLVLMLLSKGTTRRTRPSRGDAVQPGRERPCTSSSRLATM